MTIRQLHVYITNEVYINNHIYFNNEQNYTSLKNPTKKLTTKIPIKTINNNKKYD